MSLCFEVNIKCFAIRDVIIMQLPSLLIYIDLMINEMFVIVKSLYSTFYMILTRFLPSATVLLATTESLSMQNGPLT